MKKIFFSLAATALFSVSATANTNSTIKNELQKNNSKTTSVTTTNNGDGDEYQTDNNRKFIGSGEYEYIDDCQPTTVNGASHNANGLRLCECTAHYKYYVFWVGFESTTKIT